MELKGSYALVYTVNSPSNQKVFPVAGMDHAIFLAEAISRSDNLNKHVCYNSFDLCQYDRHTGEVGESWEHPDYDEFTDYWMSIEKTGLLFVNKRSSDEKRRRITELCSSTVMQDYKCVGCPYQDDPEGWCHHGRVANIPEDQLDGVLKVMEASV